MLTPIKMARFRSEVLTYAYTDLRCSKHQGSGICMGGVGYGIVIILSSSCRRYPVMWQGHLTLKNESAAVQLHFLSGNVQLAKNSLPGLGEGQSPSLRIAQRMRLEQTQLEGVQRRMQVRQYERPKRTPKEQKINV